MINSKAGWVIASMKHVKWAGITSMGKNPSDNRNLPPFSTEHHRAIANQISTASPNQATAIRPGSGEQIVCHIRQRFSILMPIDEVSELTRKDEPPLRFIPPRCRFEFASASAVAIN